MDRRVSIEKHFKQKNFSNELSDEREYKKYGMYFVDIWQYLVIIIIFLIGLIFIL